jgi:cytochrome b pre-mRNA-processing protein 3
MFSFYNKHNNNLYNKLVELSRNIFFYKELKLKDKFESRIVLIFLHFSIILIIFKKDKKKPFPQKIFDNIFLNIEYHLRELGFGDVAINKKMKLLNKIFYDILLKLDDSNKVKFKSNENIIKKHFFTVGGQKIDNSDKIGLYLDNFYNFCFELNSSSMIEGDIKFKY